VLELNKQMSDGKLVLCGAKVKDRLTGLFCVNDEFCIPSLSLSSSADFNVQAAVDRLPVHYTVVNENS